MSGILFSLMHIFPHFINLDCWDQWMLIKVYNIYNVLSNNDINLDKYNEYDITFCDWWVLLINLNNVHSWSNTSINLRTQFLKDVFKLIFLCYDITRTFRCLIFLGFVICKLAGTKHQKRLLDRTRRRLHKKRIIIMRNQTILVIQSVPINIVYENIAQFLRN